MLGEIPACAVLVACPRSFGRRAADRPVTSLANLIFAPAATNVCSGITKVRLPARMLQKEGSSSYRDLLYNSTNEDCESPIEETITSAETASTVTLSEAE